MLFFKKKRQETDINQDQGKDSGNDTDYDQDDKSANIEFKFSKKESNSPSSIGPSADIEFLKAKLAAEDEYRKALTERINHMAEEIGEVRGNVLNLQQSTEKSHARTEQAISLVEQVRPEGLMLEVKKVDAKADASKLKIASVEDMNIKIREELKAIREQLKGFRSIEETLKIASEIRDQISVYRRIEAQISKESSKVEGIFSSMESSISTLERFKTDMQNMNDTVRRIDTHTVQVDQKILTAASKQDLASLKESVNKNISYLDKEMTRFKDINKKLEEALSKLDEREKQIDILQDKLKSGIEKPFLDTYGMTHEQLEELKERVSKSIDKETFSDMRFILMKDISAMNKKFDADQKRISRASKDTARYNSRLSTLEKKLLRPSNALSKKKGKNKKKK